MCGRFTLTLTPELAEWFEVLGIDVNDLNILSQYNIAPTNQIVTIISNAGTNYARLMRWGLVPRWSKEINSKYTMINARDDKILETRSYTGPFKNQRCLIPASGYYEWRKGPNRTRLPLYFTTRTAEPMAFAGIWEKARPGGEEMLSCSIITTSPNELVQPVHDRMPAILPPGRYRDWMDPHNESVEDLLAMLQPFDAGLMQAHAVSPDVNNVRNRGAHLIQPVGADASAPGGE
jgi:putative SOS response-associated peptidase YedK